MLEAVEEGLEEVQEVHVEGEEGVLTEILMKGTTQATRIGTRTSCRVNNV